MEDVDYSEKFQKRVIGYHVKKQYEKLREDVRKIGVYEFRDYLAKNGVIDYDGD